jgi:hypothetical protein
VLRKRGGQCLVGTPRAKLKDFERELLAGGWEQVRPDVKVKLVPTPRGRGDPYPVSFGNSLGMLDKN